MKRPLLIWLVLILPIVGMMAQEMEIDCETPLEIWQIQGATDAANCIRERVHLDENIVTATGDKGFFMQTPTERSDNDPATSDGVYVFTGVPPHVWGLVPGTVVTLDRVRVEDEYGLTQIEVRAVSQVEIISPEGPLPDPVNLQQVDLTVTPGEPHPMERYEGMYVMVEDALVVSPTNYFDEYDISLTGQRAFREMGIEADVTVTLAGLGLPEWDLNPEVVEIDPPEMGLETRHVTPGSTTTVYGGLAYAYSDYQLWPASLEVDMAELTPRPVRERAAGEFTVATQNVENFFDLVDDPDKDDSPYENYVPLDAAEYQTKVVKLSALIREVLGAPDILALQEVENTRVLADLIFQIQTDDPTLRYTSCLLEGFEGRGIDVAYLVRTDRVNFHDCYRMPGSYTATLGDSNAPLFTRPPLVLEASFIQDGQEFSLILLNLHNKSLSGIDTTPTQQRRLEQAVAVAEYVQVHNTTQPEMPLIVLGDVNAFQFSDGIVDVVGIITGSHDPAEALAAPANDIVEPNLTNQVNHLPPEERYSYIWNGNVQILDHMLTNAAVDPFITGLMFGRGNADGLVIWEMDAEVGPLRVSDHDGLVMYITPPFE